MGYSITIEVRKKKLAQKMIDFLKKNGKSFGFLIGQDENNWYDGPFWANGKGDEDSKERKGLSYCHRPNHIGFDYGWDREYKHVLIRWMAQKICSLDPKTKKPRYLYDDCEWILVVPEEHDELGFMKKESPFEWAIPEHKDLVHEEMVRLNRLWEELK
jgi:hypothetical protein